MKKVHIGKTEVGGQKLCVFCGPCVIENEDMALRSAEFLKELFDKKGIELVFKASYDKANRSSIKSFRGPGIVEGLRILDRIKQELGLKIVSDVHTESDVEMAKEVLDVLQIPAFLCRQTDLLIAAAQTGKVVEVKKGQFMAPWDMSNVVTKLQEVGNENILLVDRGTSFGYNNLVSDMRAIPEMQKFGYPVGFDATHSVQLPGGEKDSSGGQREFVSLLAKGAIACGANFLFLEAHPNPEEAKSDKASQISFAALPALLDQLKVLYEVVRTL
jgi:2-dehydro-3-deoxyphosphooctonate aldolase (KDO 8-P synthase)